VRSTFTLIVTGVIVLGFVLFMITYTVRFTEVGVRSTFGRAGAGSVITEQGFGFRWPYPVQTVTLYDTRSRILRTQVETQQTADNRQIVVESFLLWQVDRDNALRFYQRFSGAGNEARDHYNAAESTLRSLLRSAMAEVSRYRMSDLLSPEAGGSKIPELEAAILERLRRPDGEDGTSMADYGVLPVLVGINRLELPEETTKGVFERMKATRERLASETETQGEAMAIQIEKDAETAAARILAFAERRAADIRSVGDLEAARYLQELAAEPRLAQFLEMIEFMKSLVARRTTLILPTSSPGMQVFDPAMMGDLGPDGLPALEKNADPYGAGAKPGGRR
jgi:membrane protease subunit HflC